MKIFGDDGFRDIYGKNLLNQKFLKTFFNNLNFILKEKKIKTIVIGHDNRKSNKNILKIILKNTIYPKKILVLNNPITTPGLQFLSKQFKCFGLMITASHFPAKYNGFKFFLNGSKLKKSYEVIIEKKLMKGRIFPKKKKIPYKQEKINQSKYIDYLNKYSDNQNNSKIKIDCSNGSASFLKNKLKFFNNSKLINFDNDGMKINLNCGSNNLEKNFKKGNIKNFEFLFAFDGDADRFLVAEKDYGVIETEKIALIYAIYFLRKKKIKNIVMTDISNPWLVNELKKVGIKKVTSKVGDRNVTDKIKKFKSFFGFETSGHFCFNHSMDGIFAASLFTKIINKDKNLIYEILKKKIDYIKIVIAIKSECIGLVKNFLSKKINKIRYTLRKSIWNDYYKLYIFYKKEDLSELKKLKKYLFDKSLKIKIKN